MGEPEDSGVGFWMRAGAIVVSTCSFAAAIYQPLVDFLHFPVSVSVRLDRLGDALESLDDSIDGVDGRVRDLESLQRDVERRLGRCEADPH